MANYKFLIIYTNYKAFRLPNKRIMYSANTEDIHEQ